MANAMWGWQNNVKAGAVTATSSVAAMGAANVQGDQGSASTAWQTAGVTSASLSITLPAAGKWRVLALARTNLFPTATIRWRVAANSAFAGQTFDSGTQTPGIAPGYGQAVMLAPFDVTGAYCQVDISDLANTDSFLNIPLIFAGPVWQLTGNVGYGLTFGRDDQVDEVVTRGGQEFPTFRFARRRWDVAMSSIRAAELPLQAMELERVSHLGANILFIPDPASTNLQREAVFGRVKTTAGIAYPYAAADRRGMSLRITERL